MAPRGLGSFLLQIPAIEARFRYRFADVIVRFAREGAGTPRLHYAEMERDNRSDGFEIRCEFRGDETRQSRPFWLVEHISHYDLMLDPRVRGYDLRRPGRLDVTSDLVALWSRTYEDHYMRRMLDAAMQGLSRLPSGSHAHQQQLDQVRTLAEHIRQYHNTQARDPNDHVVVTQEVRSRREDLLTCTHVQRRQTPDERAREQAERFQGLVTEVLGVDELNTMGSDLLHAMRDAIAALTRNSLTNELARQTTRETATEVRMRQADQESWWHRHRREYMAQFEQQVAALLYDGSAFHLAGNPEAEAKGKKLLKENLTPAQLAQYEQHGHFDVKGGQSGQTYRIYEGRQMNIDVLDAKGNPASGICFLPQGGLVAGDCMLAQKTALELMEKDALKIANKFASPHRRQQSVLGVVAVDLAAV